MISFFSRGEIISKYYGDDNNKRANVVKMSDHYMVSYFVDDACIGNIKYNKSLKYVEDAAENFVMDIFKVDDVKKYSF
jgi:esterase/lipase superfamily enzyme